MNWHDLLFVIIGFLSEVLGTLSGFGSSTFFVPIAQWIESFHLVLVLTALLHTAGNISRIYYFRKYLRKDLLLQLALPSIVLSGVGALFAAWVAVSILKQLLGFALVVMSLVFFLRQNATSSRPLLQKLSTPIVGLSGFLTGLLGTGGALRGMALASLHIEKNLFISLSSAIDLGGDLLRLGIYAWQGFMDWNQWYYVPLLIVAAWAGAKVGHRIIHIIPQKLFLQVVTASVFVSGLLLLMKR